MFASDCHPRLIICDEAVAALDFSMSTSDQPIKRPTAKILANLFVHFTDLTRNMFLIA